MFGITSFFFFSKLHFPNFINQGNKKDKTVCMCCSDHFLTLECGSPPDLNTRVQMVNCGSLAGNGEGGGALSV